jgi:FkbM family methyltransferase
MWRQATGLALPQLRTFHDERLSRMPEIRSGEMRKVTDQGRDMVATEDDVFYAYRLLLAREPDPEGWEGFRRLVAEQRTSPNELVRYFMDTPEFSVRNGVAGAESPLIEVALDGFSLMVRSNDRDIGYHIRTHRAYEPHVTAAVRTLLRPGHVFVDVGANIGYFTNMAARLVGRDGMVVAIEPLDKNLQLLYRSLERNGLENVLVHACAASDRVALMAILTDPGTSNGQPLASTGSNPSHRFVQTRRLDDLTANLPRIDVVKFDIEGFELLAWRGFRESLMKHLPTVLTEFHPYGMRQYVGVDPLDYLAELFSYADTVDILSQRPGHSTTCASAAEVMRQWEIINEAAQGEGRIHLDLLLKPRRR